MGETRVIGEWADVGLDDPPHVPQLVFMKGKWVDMVAQNWLRADLRNFRPVSKCFRELGGKPSYVKVVKFSSINEAIRVSRLNAGEKMMGKHSNNNPLELSSSHQRGDKVRESSTSRKDDKVSENQTGSDLGDKAEHCLGSNDNPFLDKLLVNGSTGKHPTTFEVNRAMRDVGKREVYVVSHDPESIGLFTSKDKIVAHQNIVVSGDNNVDDLIPNLTTSNSLDK
ncbi:hypothetical protein SUGI_0109830 [Cryptomeria japonica]|nr:hypothetical protein SUGI_0109830 [Cryptomeria japonica]